MTWQGQQGSQPPLAPEGKIREGMLDNLLRRLIRPRVEAPLFKPQVTQQGHYMLAFSPLRIAHALYDKAANKLNITVAGGRVKLASGLGFDVPDTVVQISAPAVSTTYWVYVNSTGTVTYGTTAPGSSTVDIGTVITPASWPAAANFKGVVPEYGDLHGVDRPVSGDCWVTLYDRSTYRWTGTAWEKHLTVADKRPWFSMGGAATSMPAAFVYSNPDQTVNPSVGRELTWTTALYDYGGFWNPIMPNLVTVPATGVYIVTANVWYNQGNANFNLDLVQGIKNYGGTTGYFITTADVKQNITIQRQFSAGDQLSVDVIHSSTTSRTVYGAAGDPTSISTYLAIARVR